MLSHIFRNWVIYYYAQWVLINVGISSIVCSYSNLFTVIRSRYRVNSFPVTTEK